MYKTAPLSLFKASLFQNKKLIEDMGWREHRMNKKNVVILGTYSWHYTKPQAHVQS